MKKRKEMHDGAEPAAKRKKLKSGKRSAGTLQDYNAAKTLAQIIFRSFLPSDQQRFARLTTASKKLPMRMLFRLQRQINIAFLAYFKLLFLSVLAK